MAFDRAGHAGKVQGLYVHPKTGLLGRTKR